MISPGIYRHRALQFACLFGLLLSAAVAGAADEEDFDTFGEPAGYLEFDDQPLQEPLGFPDFFKLSFLDLREDLLEAKEAGKAGIADVLHRTLTRGTATRTKE